MMTLDAHPRLDLGFYPTPIREMTRLRGHFGGAPRLWIKHDDYTGPGFGGNKVRKLEYVLARARTDRADEIITAGGITSNHARITAALCARLGIACRLVLNAPAGQPLPSRGYPASLMLDQMYGAAIHFVDHREKRVPEMEYLAQEAERAGKRPFIIPIGASTPLGALGFVRAAEELSRQASAAAVQFRAIVHSTSSGGTQAGLALGAQLFCPQTMILGISADSPASEIAETVRPIVAGAMRMLDLPEDAAIPEPHVDDRFTGPDYAIPSEEGGEALALLARIEGVVLDPVYTAKAMAGFLDLARSGPYSSADHLLFWHTGGQMALFQEVISD